MQLFVSTKEGEEDIESNSSTLGENEYSDAYETISDIESNSITYTEIHDFNSIMNDTNMLTTNNNTLTATSDASCRSIGTTTCEEDEYLHTTNANTNTTFLYSSLNNLQTTNHMYVYDQNKNYFEETYYTICRFLRELRTDITQLKQYFWYVILAHMVCVITIIAIGGAALNQVDWASKSASTQLWTVIVIVAISSFMIIFDCIGIYGLNYRNPGLLLMYKASMFVGTIACFITTIACFLYYSVDGVTGVGNAALESSHDHNNNNNSHNIVKIYILILAVFSLVIAICGMIVIYLIHYIICYLYEQQGIYYIYYNFIIYIYLKYIYIYVIIL